MSRHQHDTSREQWDPQTGDLFSAAERQAIFLKAVQQAQDMQSAQKVRVAA